MTFPQAEQYIFSLMNLPRREFMKDPRDCDVYLKRLQYLLDLLGNPEKKISHYIHVAGTSGKGSVVSFLHSMLHADGRKVGSYVSPHPTVMTERWTIGNKHMSKKAYVGYVEKIKSAMEVYAQKAQYDTPSFFEINVAMTLLHFAQEKVQWAILEAGCGGKYDGTNVIPHKDVAIVTTIGKDHMHILGSTKKEIAKRKIGIVKKGAAVFTMEKDEALQTFMERAAKKAGAKSWAVVDEKEISDVHTDLSGTMWRHNDEVYKARAIGKHQATNAMLAAAIAGHLGVKKSAIKKGIKSAAQPCRLEHSKKNVLLDSAHNAQKMRTTASFLKTLDQPLHLIVGFSADKPWKQMVRSLIALGPASITCARQTQNPFRLAVHPKEIAAFAKQLGAKKVSFYLDPETAMKKALKQRQKHGILVCTGSLFLAGQLRPDLTKGV